MQIHRFDMTADERKNTETAEGMKAEKSGEHPVLDCSAYDDHLVLVSHVGLFLTLLLWLRVVQLDQQVVEYRTHYTPHHWSANWNPPPTAPSPEHTVDGPLKHSSHSRFICKFGRFRVYRPVSFPPNTADHDCTFGNLTPGY